MCSRIQFFESVRQRFINQQRILKSNSQIPHSFQYIWHEVLMGCEDYNFLEDDEKEQVISFLDTANDKYAIRNDYKFASIASEHIIDILDGTYTIEKMWEDYDYDGDY